MRKILILLILCSVTACQITSVPAGIEPQTNIVLNQPTVVTDNFPPMVLSIDPVSGTLIHLKQRFTIEFSQEMEKKSVEAAFDLNPLVAGRFDWIDGKTVSFLPDQELPVSQKINLRINSIAENINGEKLGQPFLSQFQVADPLKVAYKFPESGTVDVDTSTSGIYLTFNQPVLSKLNEIQNPPAAFKIKPDQAGSGEWINNSTYLFTLDHGLAGGTEFQIEINRQLKSIYGTNFEISSDSNWQFKSIDPGILQVSPSVNEPIPLDQTFKLVFNQAMQTETVAANFYLEDVAGNPVQGRFYWNDLKTEMTFIPEKLLNRETTYILELMPGSLVSGGTPFRNQVSLTYTTIQAFQLLSTIPTNQQPIDIINGESRIELKFSSSLNPDLNFRNYISVNPPVENLKFFPDSSNKSLFISGSMTAGQTYQVLVSKYLTDNLGSNLDKDYFFEYFISPPAPAINVNEIFGNNLLLLSDRNPKINFNVVNIESLSLLLERLSFSDFASIQNKEILIENGFENRQLKINTNILPNQNKDLEIDLEKFKLNLSPGIYRLTFSSENDYRYQLFVLLNHYSIYSKSSENQLFIWLPNYDEVLNTENSKVRIFNDAFQFLYETELDKKGIAIIDPYLYGRQNLNFWIEFGSPGDKNYSLVFVDENINGKEVNNQSENQTSEPDFDAFFISDQLVYRPKDQIHFYAALRSNNETEFSIPAIKEFKFLLKKVDNEDILEQTNVVLSEFGTLSGEISIPENLSEGSYQIGFEPQIIPNKLIFIENDNYDQENISIKFNSDRYVAGDNISILIESPSMALFELNKEQIHWTLGYTPIEDDSRISKDSEKIVEPKIIAENSQYLDKNGRLSVDIVGQEVVKSLPNLNGSYLLTATLEITNSEGLQVVLKSESVIYPERYRIDVETKSFYMNDPTSIKANIFSKSLDQKLIGAIAINVILEKAISGINESEIDEWGGLYKGFLRTDGQGFVEYEAFLNGPGIYKLTVLSGNWKITKIFYVAGKGKTQYPLGEDKNIPVVLEKTEFAIDETAKIFIPNPYNGPAIALLTIERENVLYQDVLEITDSFLVYEFPIKKEYGPNVFISLMMVGKEGPPLYKFGMNEISINLEEKKLTISTDFNISTNDSNHSVSVDIFIKDSADQPVQSEIFIQSYRSGSLLEKDQDLIFEDFYHNHQNMVSSNYSGINIPISENYVKTDGQEIVGYENIIPAQTLWVKRGQTDENGHVVVDFPLPYDSKNTWLKIFAITEDLKIGKLTKLIPPGFTASIIPHVPQFVNRGDRFQLGLQITNLLDFPQTIGINVELQNLILTGELSKQVTLGVGESKEVSWQVMAEKSGQEFVNFLVSNPAEESILISQTLNVNELPAITKTVINGYLSAEGQQNYYYGISKNINFAEGVITTYMIPSLTSSLVAGIENFPNVSLTVEQKVWSLLAYTHMMQLIQTSGVDEATVEKRLREQIKGLTQSLFLIQNQDGGWSKTKGNLSDPYLTAYCAWGLKLSESIIKNADDLYLNNALDFLVANLSDPESINEAALLDKQALLYFAINFIDNKKINLNDFIPYIEFSTNEGKIFLGIALEMNNRGDKTARKLIKEVESSIEESNTDFYFNDNQFSQEYFKSRSSQIALTIFALSSIDPANIILDDLIPDLMNAQKSPGQWDSILETSLGLIAISRYLQGRGFDNGTYEFDANLNNIHIINGLSNPISFLPPISNQYEIENKNNDHLYDLNISRSSGTGTLYFLTTISFFQMVNDMNASNSEFTIQRYFYYPENEINLPDCLKNLCFGEAISVAKSTDELIQVFLIMTNSKDQQNVFLKENIPAGMVLQDISDSELKMGDNFYNPLIRYSENFLKYQNQTQDTLNWFAEELPAGTYVVSYFLTPEFIGQFSILPAQIWARFSASTPSHNGGQTLTIINR